MRVLLAAMPFSGLHYPSIGLSLLQPALRRIGAACDIRYFFLDFADRIGVDAHDVLTDPEHYQAFAGEWVFTGEAHGRDDPESSLAYFGEVFAEHYPRLHSAERVLDILAARAAAGPFIAACADEVAAAGYDLVGFTTSYQQTMASLALARALKRRAPATTIVFGGANCRGDMGLALLEHYGFVDAVCLDEGDRAFPEYVRRLGAGEPPEEIPAMAVRAVGGAVRRPRRATDPVERLDALPDPDFSDFFAQHARSAAAATHPPALLLETARGCWWGAKHHCTFCGINGRSMAFRSKSQDRAYDEIRRLVARHGTTDFVSVDAILDMGYFDGLLPRLARDGPAITMYCELKSNLRPEHMALLSRAGLKRIQPGIEALDDELLRLMRKGCTAMQNVQALKLAAECGLYVEWNLLHGFPGETAEAYARTAALIPLLLHLQPPNAVGAIRADRFSPYFERPGDFGISLEPIPAYRFVFPFGEGSVRRLAYHFLIDGPGRAADLARPAIEHAGLWKRHHAGSALTAEDDGGAVVVRDARWGAPPRTHRLEGTAAAVHRLCWRATSRGAIAKALPGHAAEAIGAALGDLAARGLLLVDRDVALALALRQPGYARAPTWDQIRAAAVEPYMLRAASCDEAIEARDQSPEARGGAAT